MSSLLTIGQLLRRVESYADADFLKTSDGSFSYSDLGSAVREWQTRLEQIGTAKGTIGLVADYSLHGIATLLALWSRQVCVALLPAHAKADPSYLEAGHVQLLLDVQLDGEFSLRDLEYEGDNALLKTLAKRNNPGLVIFSSGSSGQPKAVLHDFNRFVAKFETPGKRLSTYAFLMFDHVAGQDTLLYTLNAGGCLVADASRRPATVAALVEKHAVEVLPASPTFLNLLLASGSVEQFDLSSVKIITYGSEPMDPTTLRRLADAFPNARIIQKYGTSEFGAIRSQSRSNDSLFIKLKEDETQARIQDGLLWIKASGAMMGYLNAPSTLNDDGWICTGDLVEQDGDWLRILGRKSDLINVGGEKVVPAEVESIILELDSVADCTVRGEKHALVGMIVAAEVAVTSGPAPTDPAERREITKLIRRHCLSRLPKHKVPVSITFSDTPNATERQKKNRRQF